MVTFLYLIKQVYFFDSPGTSGERLQILQIFLLTSTLLGEHKIMIMIVSFAAQHLTTFNNSFKKFYGRYPDLIGKYQRSVKDMVADSFPD